MTNMNNRDVKNPFLFEIAWEVVNKVGGIYTVIKSKTPVTVHEYGDRYCLIGPLVYKTAAAEVEPEEITNWCIKEILDDMSSQGIKWMYGRWLIEGSPRVLLLDPGSISDRLDSWKADLWNVTGIPSPPNDTETNDSILFGYLVAWFLNDFVRKERSKAVIAHFHEWMSSIAIPLMRKRRTDLTTIFTTHATLLGRYLCAGSVDFYNNIDKFQVDEEAGKRGIYHRYCIERAASHCCDVFTTVSQITAYEAEHLLRRKPDGVLPNGLNVVKFSAMHEFQNLHARNKEKIHNFVRGHFYGHYDFDLDNTLYFFTAGRYEYRNKGVDMFVESLSRLNTRLKQSNSSVTVVAFVIMPAATQSFAVEALKGQAVTKQLQETVKDITDRIGQRIFEKAARYAGGDIQNAVIDPSELLTNEEKVLLKRRVIALKRGTLPPIVTHNMIDDATDPVLMQLRRLQLFNHPSDRVKVIFHPEFLSSNNPLIGLDYEEFVRACHLGVFPSYYEPWGYTPAECTVMGVPSITTNLSGFGCYMDETIENSSDYGIYIVDRRMKSVEESVQQLANYMLEFCQKSRRQRINQRNRTERLSDLLDWKIMGMEYVRARRLALHRAYPDSFVGEPDNEFENPKGRIPRPFSVPGSPRIKGSNGFDDLAEQMEDLVGLYFRTTRTFFLPFLPIAAWLILFYSCRFIPGSSRPHIYVSVLPALENILYGDNLSAIIATNTNLLKDVLAWLPYGVFHFMLPFLTSLGLWWFGPPGILAVFSRAFGYMNIAGVLTQLAFPCSPPWYEYVHGIDTPASYSMQGDPGGLARIDELFNSNTYSLVFGGSPMVFGAFPSLHSGCAIIQALFISHLLPKTRPIWFAYVLWIWWACMYLTHHYMVDLVGGGIYAFVTFWISWKIEIASSTLCEEDLDLVNNNNKSNSSNSNSSSIENIIIIK
ncbi:6956_t:CDS:2 [Diversispora eburnea]|uniref:Glycogen [starch] synthase n=1 Tax=Diversispora eburnea TaxID=1213867 RepID=A0A9N8YQN7_9GLOM|nr:6956_t:CDS:2 [Diversispora eburnea]